MLYNQNGQIVNIDKKYNSKEQPHMFADLLEVLEPKDGHHHGSMFSIEERAKLIDQRTH